MTDYLLDERVSFYTRGESLLNFGDYLSDFLARELLLAPIYQADVFRLVGSVISNEIIQSDLSKVSRDNAVIAYWGCGARNEDPIDRDLVRHCEFFGVRGPLTRKKLELSDDTPMGDPGFLTPLAYSRPRPSDRVMGRMACMPHFSQLEAAEELSSAAGAEVMLSPAVRSIDDLKRLIDEIASVDFLLTASLHGAILACAYGKPFALWDNGYVDAPFKWADFAASIGIEPRFFRTIENCREWYDEIEGAIRRPRLLDILGCCPFAPRPSALISAAMAEIGVARDEADRISARADQLFVERPQVRAQIASRAAAYRRESGDAKRLGARTARKHLGKELEDIGHELNDLMARVHLKSKANSFDIDQSNHQLTFSAGQVGVNFLRGGWTAPNEVAPWSVPPIAEICIPFGVGWEKARSVALSGYMFAPPVSPFNGQRRLVVWLNGARVWDGMIANESDGHVALFRIDFELPVQARSSDGPLIFQFVSDPSRSPKELGISEDDRPIGIALTCL